MSKKFLGLIFLMFLVFIAGVTAQSKPSAATLVSRFENLAREFEALARETGNLADKSRITQQELNRAETHRQTLLSHQAQNQSDFRNYFAGGKDLSPDQQNRLNNASERILNADYRIAANIRTINSKK
jgi:hypothetical protein